jgi:hypothetical protein
MGSFSRLAIVAVISVDAAAAYSEVRRVQQGILPPKATGSCDVCMDGSPPPFPDNDLTPAVEAEGYSELLASIGITQVSCGTAQTLLPLIPGGLNRTQCDSLQQAGVAVCGCADGSDATAPSKSPVVSFPSRGSVDSSSFCSFCGEGIDPSLETEDVPELFSSFDTDVTCDEVTTLGLNLTGDRCTQLQRRVSKRCGCEEPPSSVSLTPTDPPSLSETVPGTLSQNQTAAPIPSSRCTLCWDGSVPTSINKDMTRILTGSQLTRAYMLSFNLTNVTCGQLNLLLSILGGFDDSSCYFIQKGLGGICGCLPPVDSCVFCPDDPTIPFPDRPFPYSKYKFETELTCSEISGVIAQLPVNDEFCTKAHSTNFACGCNEGNRQYLGTKSTGQRAALAWIPRVSGGLSLLGSLYIVIDVVLRCSNRPALALTITRSGIQQRPVYDTLVGVMAGFDAVTSVCWVLSSAPSWKHDQFDAPSGVYGALGNYETCKTQGFFLQLSATGSLFYNVVLAVYYYLVIVYSAREERIKKYIFVFLAPPAVVAVFVSLRGLPYYTTVFIVCTIPPPPTILSWDILIKLTLFPIAFCLLTATVLTVAIYLSVKKSLHASRRHDFSYSSQLRSSEFFSDSPLRETHGTDLERNVGMRTPARTLRNSTRLSRHNTSQDRALGQVFWQCVFYLAAFLISYPVWFTALIIPENTSYSLWIAVVIFTPLQGFLNFIVYARSRRSTRSRVPSRRRPLHRTDPPNNDMIDGSQHMNHRGRTQAGSSSPKPVAGVRFEKSTSGEAVSSTREDDTSYSLDVNRSCDQNPQPATPEADRCISERLEI